MGTGGDTLSLFKKRYFRPSLHFMWTWALIECSECMQFYFQNGRPPPIELKGQCLSRIDELFSGHLDGLQVQGEVHIWHVYLVHFAKWFRAELVIFSPSIISEFKSVTKEICKLPSFFSSTLFRKIDVDCIGIIKRYSFNIIEKICFRKNMINWVAFYLFFSFKTDTFLQKLFVLSCVGCQ